MKINCLFLIINFQLFQIKNENYTLNKKLSKFLFVINKNMATLWQHVNYLDSNL